MVLNFKLDLIRARRNDRVLPISNGITTYDQQFMLVVCIATVISCRRQRNGSPQVVTEDLTALNNKQGSEP